MASSFARAQGDASALVAQLFTAFSAGKFVNSVQLSGSATWYAGSDTNTGPITLIVSADGSASISMQMTKWSRAEQQTAFGDSRTCTWSGTDGVLHQIEDSGCWIPQVWFLPQAALQAGHIPADIATEVFTPEGIGQSGFLGLRSQSIVGPGTTAAAVTNMIQKESTAELVISNATLEPVQLSYRLPMNQGSAERMRVEIRYSEYKQLSGLTIPTHIERYINGSLQMAIDLSQATLQN